MTEVGFYHLTRQTAERALARLLGRTLDAGQRALVLLPDAPARDALDDALWLQQDRPWLPHGTARMGHAELQPVWLATREEVGEASAPNRATFLFVLRGAVPARLEAYARVFDLFAGGEAEEVERARARYRAARTAGHAVAYWREAERGWERAA